MSDFLWRLIAFKNFFGLFFLLYAYSAFTRPDAMVLLSIRMFTQGIITPEVIGLAFLFAGLYMILAPFTAFSVIVYNLPLLGLTLLLALMVFFGYSSFLNPIIYNLTIAGMSLSYAREKLHD